MLDRLAFVSVFFGRKMPVIMTGRRPICWRCGETVQLFPSSLEEAAGLPDAGDPNTSLADTVSSVTSVIGTAAEKNLVWFPPNLPHKNVA